MAVRKAGPRNEPATFQRGKSQRRTASSNLTGMPSWNERQRTDFLTRYRRSGLTQDQFCAELRTAGVDLSPRTLRTWIARLEPPEGAVEACLQAVDFAMKELRPVSAILATFDSEEQGRHAAPVERELSEPQPPTGAGLPSGIPATVEAEPGPPATTSSLGPMPDGMPRLSQARKTGRLRWG